MTPQQRLQYFLSWAPKIYGRYWRTDLPKHWKLNRRTVWNWASGRSEVDFQALLLLNLYRKMGHVYDRVSNTVGEFKSHEK